MACRLGAQDEAVPDGTGQDIAHPLAVLCRVQLEEYALCMDGKSHHDINPPSNTEIADTT